MFIIITNRINLKNNIGSKMKSKIDLFDNFNICKYCEGKGYKEQKINDYFSFRISGNFATTSKEKCIKCNGTGQKQTVSFDNKFMKDYR